jgi:hypothetical protein
VGMRTASFASRVASLGGSRIMTDRLICTMGTPAIARSVARSGCDWEATTYRCLLVSPASAQLAYDTDLRYDGLTHDASETFVPGYGLAVVAFSTLEGLREIDHVLLGFPLQIKLMNTALRDHWNNKL